MGRKDANPPAAPTMRRHAALETATLLRRLAYEVSRASKSGGEGAVHDLRVAIRRLAQCLRVFDQFFPHGKARKLRRALKEMVDLASEVRDRDVATELLAKAKIAPESGLQQRLLEERNAARRALVTELKRWVRNNSSRKWRSALEI